MDDEENEEVEGELIHPSKEQRHLRRMSCTLPDPSYDPYTFCAGTVSASRCSITLPTSSGR